MTVNALRRSTSPEGQERALVIGDPDGAIFVCATCARPMASGVRRCPGCGANYILDVPFRKAGVLVAMGLATGLIVGGGGIGLAALTRSAPVTAEPGATVAPQPTVATPTGAVPTAASTAGPGLPAIPPAAVAALRGTSTINARIAEIAVPLAAAASAGETDASRIARLLRRLSVEVGAAQTLVDGLGTWDEASSYATELGQFYATLLTRVRTGLDSSVRDADAYRDTASDVVAIAEALPALEATGQELAARATTATP